jgi:hypothetical protein
VCSAKDMRRQNYPREIRRTWPDVGGLLLCWSLYRDCDAGWVEEFFLARDAVEGTPLMGA